MVNKIFIGIDPGSVKTGVAYWNTKTKNLTLQQFDSHCTALFAVHAEIDRSIRSGFECWMVIEDARMARKIPTHVLKKLGHNPEGTKQGAGYVKALSKDWEAFAKMVGCTYTLLAPNSRITKTTPEHFKALTGITTKKTEHHLRDAGMLVFQRNHL